MPSSKSKPGSSVLLAVTGEDLEPDDVSNALGMTPFQSWRRGERKNFVYPDGRIKQFDTIHERGEWKKLIPEKYRDLPLCEQFSLWLACLREHTEAIHVLAARGWEVELNCFTCTSDVLILRNSILRELADLGVDVAFETGSVRKVDSPEMTPDRASRT